MFAFNVLRWCLTLVYLVACSFFSSLGRLLLFPHMCPHEGRMVETLPKILLRGELLDVSASEEAERKFAEVGY